MAITIALIIGGTIWAIAFTGRTDSAQREERPNADELLAHRLARGEITEDDYKRQRDLISRKR
jgi:uncharacterized membrane protein